MRGLGDLRSSILGRGGALISPLKEEGIRGVCEIVQLCLYALKRRDSQYRFCDASAESSDDRSRAGYLAIGVLKEGFVGVKCDEACSQMLSFSALASPPNVDNWRSRHTYARLERVPNNQRRASRIPLPSEWGPGKLLRVR
jgi:hypothetical protein